MHDTRTLARIALLGAVVMLLARCGDRPATSSAVAAQKSPTPAAKPEARPAAAAKPAAQPAAAVPAPAVPTPVADTPDGEDAYTAQGRIPDGVDLAGMRGDAWFFTVGAREGRPVAIVPVTVAADGLAVATWAHHHPGQAMITEVRLESPTLAPWWSIAWPDGKLTIGKPLARAEAIRLHGILTTEEDGAALPDVRIFGDVAGTILGRSDDQGRFECWVPKEQAQAHLLPFASTLVGHSRFVDATAYDDQDLHLSVERGMRIRFQVVDTEGRPLPGAVVIWTGGASYQGQTDTNGEVTIGMVSCTTPHEPEVLLDGYQPVKPVGKIVAKEYADQPLVIVMERSDARVEKGK